MSSGLVTAAIYHVEIGHTRAAPVRHVVRQRSYLWFVDVDDLPVLPRGLRWLARFEARDHAGDPTRTIRHNVEDFLRSRGVTPPAGPMTMLANARSAGYVFNPLSVFWCHHRDGTVAATVLEVHNTNGEVHRYLLQPDEAGRAEVAKAFYVSPFYPVDGHYRVSAPEPGDRLALTVTLHRPGDRLFSATVRGVRRAATTREVVATALRFPLHTHAVRALITGHGIALWRKGLPVIRRPGARGLGAAARVERIVRDVAGVDLPVRVRAWDGSEAGPESGPVVQLRSRRALRRLLWSPNELGLARAYVSGDLDIAGDVAGDGGSGRLLTDALRLGWAMASETPMRAAKPMRAATPVAVARAAASAVRLGALGLPPTPPACEARMTGGLHTRLRDRAAISHHYDLSNDFYELLLDESMAYSCAYPSTDGDSLAAAQRAKLDLICRKLELRPGRTLLDVGCGWGSLVLHAAEHYGVSATGITLSANQHDFVAKRVAERGVSGLVTVRLQDYRDQAGRPERFDAVASIEMGEHVGESTYSTYASVLYGALRPGGRLLLQQMSRAAAAAPGGGKFIETYIAPDMHMRPVGRTVGFLRAAGFDVSDVEPMGPHYAWTARRWLDRLEDRYEQFVAMAGADVARVWLLYLAGGALSFEQGRMGVDQILATRPTG